MIKPPAVINPSTDHSGTKIAVDAARRAELGAYLRARRADIMPEDVGLPRHGQRRTPGLRREEVAQLAGVGIAWYTWLEQGRVQSTSTQVLDAIGRALRLDGEGIRHIRSLAGLPLPARNPDDELPEGITSMLENLLPNPACVYDWRFDYRAWNRAFTLVWRDLDSLPVEHRNLIWIIFKDPAIRELVDDWSTRAQLLLAHLRATLATHPNDARMNSLIAELNETSPEFREWWPRYVVSQYSYRAYVIHHSAVGTITFDATQLSFVLHPTLLLLIQTPRTDTDRRALMTLLNADQPKR